jgi:hypothetical protein
LAGASGLKAGSLHKPNPDKNLTMCEIFLLVNHMRLISVKADKHRAAQFLWWGQKQTK